MGNSNWPSPKKIITPLSIQLLVCVKKNIL